MLIELRFLKKLLTNWYVLLMMLGREAGSHCFVKLLAYCIQSLNT